MPALPSASMTSRRRLGQRRVARLEPDGKRLKPLGCGRLPAAFPGPCSMSCTSESQLLPRLARRRNARPGACAPGASSSCRLFSAMAGSAAVGGARRCQADASTADDLLPRHFLAEALALLGELNPSGESVIMYGLPSTSISRLSCLLSLVAILVLSLLNLLRMLTVTAGIRRRRGQKRLFQAALRPSAASASMTCGRVWMRST